LISGDLTRVYVASDQPKYVLLPHTLGLPVTAYSDHLIDPRSTTQHTEAELRRIAERLAAGDRWITGYGSTCWDHPFIANAQIALILVSRSWRIRQRIEAITSLTRSVAHDLAARDGEHFSSGTQVGSLLELSDGPDSGSGFRRICDHLWSHYPDKTVQVGGRALRQLRAVRPRPTPEEIAASLDPVGRFLLEHPRTEPGQAPPPAAGNRAERRGHRGPRTRDTR
jgi:hypothetical protein